MIDSLDARSRLWIAALKLAAPVTAYLQRYGFPIRYSYVKESWPSAMYQTVYADEFGSAGVRKARRANESAAAFV